MEYHIILSEQLSHTAVHWLWPELLFYDFRSKCLSGKGQVWVHAYKEVRKKCSLPLNLKLNIRENWALVCACMCVCVCVLLCVQWSDIFTCDWLHSVYMFAYQCHPPSGDRIWHTERLPFTSQLLHRVPQPLCQEGGAQVGVLHLKDRSVVGVLVWCIITILEPSLRLN